ncbi:hypothetical protein V8G54_026911 [Vigna mungo]|uniref:Uncharacterized protein n=1 Tax=Vigna mungo TaxID=3915 RepID=A0AAQ3RNL9_VIGMU
MATQLPKFLYSIRRTLSSKATTVGLVATGLIATGASSVYMVEPGYSAVVFNRITTSTFCVEEGIHFLLPSAFGVQVMATKRSWASYAQDAGKLSRVGSHEDIYDFARKDDTVVCCLGLNNETVEHMQYYVEYLEEISKLSQVKAQVYEIKGFMMDNIEKE